MLQLPAGGEVAPAGPVSGWGPRVRTASSTVRKMWSSATCFASPSRAVSRGVSPVALATAKSTPRACSSWTTAQEHATTGEVEVFDARSLEDEQMGRRRSRRHDAAHPVAKVGRVGEVQRRVDTVGHDAGHRVHIGPLRQRPPHGGAVHPAEHGIARPGAAPGAIEDRQQRGQQDAGTDPQEHDRGERGHGDPELDPVEAIDGFEVVQPQDTQGHVDEHGAEGRFGQIGQHAFGRHDEHHDERARRQPRHL